MAGRPPADQVEVAPTPQERCRRRRQPGAFRQVNFFDSNGDAARDCHRDGAGLATGSDGGLDQPGGQRHVVLQGQRRHKALGDDGYIRQAVAFLQAADEGDAVAGHGGQVGLRVIPHSSAIGAAGRRNRSPVGMSQMQSAPCLSSGQSSAVRRRAMRKQVLEAQHQEDNPSSSDMILAASAGQTRRKSCALLTLLDAETPGVWCDHPGRLRHVERCCSIDTRRQQPAGEKTKVLSSLRSTVRYSTPVASVTTITGSPRSAAPGS